MRSTKTPVQEINAETPDSVLIALVVKHCEPALNELMHRYKAKLFEFIVRYVNDTELAYDILQETFTRVYFKSDSFKPEFSFSTWLYQIAINLCRDWIRKNRRQQWISLNSYGSGNDQNPLEHDWVSSDEENIDHVFDIKQQLEAVQQEIHKLPDKLKITLILFAVEGNSQARCAEILGVSAKAVEARVYRARKILMNKLEISF